MIAAAAHPDANIIWGTAFNEEMNDEMSVTVIATGFDTLNSDGMLPPAQKESPVNARPQAPQPAKEKEPPAQEISGEDKDFEGIMSIFNRHR